MPKSCDVSLRLVGITLALLAGPQRAPAAPADDLVARIRAVGKEGAGNVEVARAWKQLVAIGPDALPTILAAVDENDPTASNWLRAAADAISEKALAAKKPLPADKLERFVADQKNPPAGRRLAYEWLARADKTAPERLLPGMLQDPSAELRRDAVAAVLREAQALFDKDDKTGATAAYRKALTGACDEDQVKLIADQLKKLGTTVDLAAHYGFVRHWHLVAPFDNTAGAGFAQAYPPEKGVDLKATYTGKAGAEARWTAHVSDDPHGLVDLNKTLGKQKGTVAYAYAVIDVPAARTAQLRAGSPNALKLLVNGKEVFAHEEYHHGIRIDQYSAPVTLKAGRNELLVKVCQNEQSQDWAQSWVFQLRLCDQAGAAVPWKPVEVKGDAKTKEGAVKP